MAAAVAIRLEVIASRLVQSSVPHAIRFLQHVDLRGGHGLLYLLDRGETLGLQLWTTTRPHGSWTSLGMALAENRIHRDRSSTKIDGQDMPGQIFN